MKVAADVTGDGSQAGVDASHLYISKVVLSNVKKFELLQLDLDPDLNIFAGDTYLPGYVRLRMLGCAAFGGALAAEHSGSTSASAGGCDGAVVPTLVDLDADAVIVDSKRICLHLDDQMPNTVRLRPAALAPG